MSGGVVPGLAERPGAWPAGFRAAQRRMPHEGGHRLRRADQIKGYNGIG
jgi:hypothetical protein